MVLKGWMRQSDGREEGRFATKGDAKTKTLHLDGSASIDNELRIRRGRARQPAGEDGFAAATCGSCRRLHAFRAGEVGHRGSDKRYRFSPDLWFLVSALVFSMFSASFYNFRSRLGFVFSMFSASLIFSSQGQFVRSENASAARFSCRLAQRPRLPA